MTWKRTSAASAAALGMLILILDGQTALSGAREGIELCIRTVIPSLFPFFIFSSMLVGSLDARWLRPAARLCGVPDGAEALLLVGFLGGYPTGAQCVTRAYHSAQLSKSQAERMLAFCNNAGPSFLFGMVAQMFEEAHMVWLLWAVHIFSAVLVALTIPKNDDCSASVSLPSCSISQALSGAVRTMALVCGWVVLFRIAITFLNRWFLWLLPETWQVITRGLLELANGCCALLDIEAVSLRFLVSAGLLGFGGLCVTMQTVSVTGGLSLKYYMPGKLLQTLLSLILAYTLQMTFPQPFRNRAFCPVLVGCALLLILFLRKMKNSSGIPQLVGV